MIRIVERVRGILAHPEQTQVSLGVVALFVLIFGFWYLRTAIHTPFAPQGTGSQASSTPQNQVTGAAPTTEDRTKDTDGDGLTDYDEVHVYRTSPYLKDTDSDGYDDKTEVTTGNDPLCPKGQTCLRSSPFAVASGSDQGSGSPSTDLVPAQGTTPTADQIRQILKQQGATDAQLAKYSDAALVQLYQEVAGQSQDSSSSSSATSTTTPSATGTGTSSSDLTSAQKDALRKMTGSQLRDFLIKGGATKDFLDNFDDATLQALVKEQLGL